MGSLMVESREIRCSSLEDDVNLEQSSLETKLYERYHDGGNGHFSAEAKTQNLIA